MMKVVLDTNVLINATQDEFAYEKRIIDEVINGNIQAYATNPMIRENQLLLDKEVSDGDGNRFLNDYFTALNEVEETSKLKIIEMDPDDDKFINAAISAGAGYIVTNDAHLLDHDGFEGISIVKPEVFWNKYDDDRPTGLEWMMDLVGV